MMQCKLKYSFFCHTDAKNISFDHKKYRAKVPIRKREAQENIVERRSTLTIRLKLDFKHLFLFTDIIRFWNSLNFNYIEIDFFNRSFLGYY